MTKLFFVPKKFLILFLIFSLSALGFLEAGSYSYSKKSNKCLLSKFWIIQHATVLVAGSILALLFLVIAPTHQRFM